MESQEVSDGCHLTELSVLVQAMGALVESILHFGINLHFGLCPPADTMRNTPVVEQIGVLLFAAWKAHTVGEMCAL